MLLEHVAATYLQTIHISGHVTGTCSRDMSQAKDQDLTHTHENIAGTCPWYMLQGHAPCVKQPR